jgi:hypothetical protein
MGPSVAADLLVAPCSVEVRAILAPPRCICLAPRPRAAGPVRCLMAAESDGLPRPNGGTRLATAVAVCRLHFPGCSNKRPVPCVRTRIGCDRIRQSQRRQHKRFPCDLPLPSIDCTSHDGVVRMLRRHRSLLWLILELTSHCQEGASNSQPHLNFHLCSLVASQALRPQHQTSITDTTRQPST